MGDHLASVPEKVQAKRVGLIVNPIAGIGGRVGLKGSDGATIQRRAFELGAVPEASRRAAEALLQLDPIRDQLDLLTCPGEMGQDAAEECGFAPRVIGSIRTGETTARDTRDAAQEMARLGASLLLFAGGDGTARDICDTIGEQVAVVGIPAGVKIHSAAFGVNPRCAGDLALAYLTGRVGRLRTAEVMDIDEGAVRRGVVAARLTGYLRVPYRSRLLQGLKSASPAGELGAMRLIAGDVLGRMEADCYTILGPGTTTRAIAERLGLPKTLIGVDVVANGKVVAADANEKQLLALIEGRSAMMVVTPIGGQGYLFGRGNQQLSWRVIREVGKEKIMVVSTPSKIASLRGRPLWVDTGDRAVDESLQGYVKIITGYKEQIVYRVAC